MGEMEDGSQPIDFLFLAAALYIFLKKTAILVVGMLSARFPRCWLGVAIGPGEGCFARRLRPPAGTRFAGDRTWRGHRWRRWSLALATAGWWRRKASPSSLEGEELPAVPAAGDAGQRSPDQSSQRSHSRLPPASLPPVMGL